jgi:hypothetical protein
MTPNFNGACNPSKKNKTDTFVVYVPLEELSDINSNPTRGGGVKMKRFNYGLFFVGIVAAICMVTMPSCNKNGDNPLTQVSEDVCGPCGEIAKGDFGISGDAQLDGFFQAVGTVQTAVASVKAKFDADVLALADVYDLKANGEVNAQFITDLKAKIKADIAANLDGELQINYQPPKCTASVEASFSAQAKCEARANCDVDVTAPHASVKCEGSCSGGCTGSCSGDLSCKVKAPSVACEGQCEGSCEMSAAAKCDGTCHGSCSGNCDVKDGSGNCAGKCDADCNGTCEFSAKAECKGTCHGSCYVEQGSAQCTGDIECSGKCDAQCSGSCQGDFTPPSASAECEASAKCEAQAKANAQANLECTPPSLDIGYKFKAGVDAAAQAGFMARLGELKVRGAAILQGSARLSALIDGKVDGQTVFAPSPMAQLTTSLKGFTNVNAFADLDIPAGRLGCVVPAFEDAITALVDVGTSVTATIEAQASIATFLTTGK